MIGMLLLFMLGSALCGAAQSMTWLIGARGSPIYLRVCCRTIAHLLLVVQGLGAGGLQALPNIIVSDLVPLAERGPYQGILSLCVSTCNHETSRRIIVLLCRMWAIAGLAGVPIAGALASHGQWRWFFCMSSRFVPFVSR